MDLIQQLIKDKKIGKKELAEFEKAANHFEKISDLCIELGDDSLGREFYEKGKKIREMFKKASSPPPEKIEQPEIEQTNISKPEINREQKVEKEDRIFTS